MPPTSWSWTTSLLLVSFANASTAGFEHRGPKDVAELLAATAAIVG